MFSIAMSATSSRPVLRRYVSVFLSNGNIEQVAPSSAPILHIVDLPVAEIVATPSPKYSRIEFVPPFTVSMPSILRITSFGEAQPERCPDNFTPISFGILSSQGCPVRTSTASAPPTPTAIIPSPPAFGVCESVPTIIPPGKA